MKRVTPQERNIGAKIRAYRMERHWSQAVLSAKLQLLDCDLSREIIARIESGCRAVSVYEIDKFVEVFGVSYDALFEK